MILDIFFIVIGLVMLVLGAEGFVKGASVVAKKLRVSELAIGLTVVAFGTSTPDLVVNSFASFQGNSDLVFGNVLGSNNFNLFMILGIAGLITPMVVQSSTAWREIPISFAAALLVFILVNDGITGFETSNALGYADAIILAVCFIGFLYYVKRQLKSEPGGKAEEIRMLSTSRTILFIVLGLAGLVIGGRLVVDYAVALATGLGVSEKVIGLTIVAAGTSLPELATSVIAAIRKNNDIAVGNIIGSNVFNLLLILSVSAFVQPLNYNPSFNTDLYLLGGGTLLLFIGMWTGGRKKLDRWEAVLLLVTFVIYTVVLLG
ncbi:MAG: calcium/sodium antiporter [Bacteroidales bacterium]